MNGLVALALFIAGADDDAVARARDAEARAFEHVQAGRLCEASAAFALAHGFTPREELLFNAALAADRTGDAERALSLYGDLVKAYPASPRTANHAQRIGELSRTLREGDARGACKPIAVTTTTAPAVDDPPTAVAAATPSVVVDELEGPPLPHATAVATARGVSFLPWTALAVSAVVGVAGVCFVAVGVLPYVGHAMTRAAIEDAGAARRDATALQEQQAGYRMAWESWGEPLFLAGVPVVVVGGAAGAASLAWGIVDVATSGAVE